MAKRTKRSLRMSGLTPGTILHAGKKKPEGIRVTIIDYNEAQFQEKEVKKAEECFPFKDKPTVTWINIDGLDDFAIMEKVGKHFNMHPMVLEDIVNTTQRPKFEEFEEYLYIVLKMFYINENDNEIHTEQVSLILGPSFVISFQESQGGDVFNPVRERIRTAKGRIRKMGADYLAYALFDSIVDSYYQIMERMGEKIEEIEDELVFNPTPETLQTIHDLKRDTIFLRKSVWPLREVAGGLQRSESKLIQESTEIYLRDVYDHTIQVIDTIETFRDMISGMLDIYLSSLSNRMNEVMKVLTIIATIFIPITFISGVYGMNFRYMPELNWHWAYFGALGLMLMVVITMLIYFKRKKWI
ncbi:MAG: magnesium/cobalt transporter CorA [Candidatus Omnitrophota bacterium]